MTINNLQDSNQTIIVLRQQQKEEESNVDQSNEKILESPTTDRDATQGTMFEEFDLDDIEIIESKVFA